MTGSTDRSDPVESVGAILDWLDRWGWQAIPHGPIPPEDPAALGRARTEAESVAMGAGRIGALRELRHAIIEWALGRYRVAALGAVYFSGALEPPEQRREAIEILIDAATANLLGDLLTDDTRSTLLTRLDVSLGVSLGEPLVDHDAESR